ncbi:hypothetical protein ALI22I_09710 [Saccharothrix sp. ALI-22-I]|uniref:hypothetical protein n=1 Tax=Saccharothrix sp. ALI-22-I TaxID=1933778 RepID=UPI00097C65E8|nr:hypothetical protein [Saccharothrix sp. ALI-22-I]ONI91055.1 hypothetical protein ALI22I_09710 [Saccharothrix sp. ALI-22-I]
MVRVRAAGVSAAVGRALARTGARSVVVPPRLPEDLVPDGHWSRLEDVPPLTVGGLDGADAVVTTAAPPPSPGPWPSTTAPAQGSAPALYC